MLQRLLLLPLLSPLLAVLLLSAFNPRPAVALRLLTWTSPRWPIGAWIAAAASAGAGLSGLAAALALQGQAVAEGPRRQVRRRTAETATWDDADQPTEPAQPSSAAWAGPSRSAAEPAPTVSVPFRVIRRGERQAAAAAPPSQPAASATSADDWDAPARDDW